VKSLVKDSLPLTLNEVSLNWGNEKLHPTTVNLIMGFTAHNYNKITSLSKQVKETIYTQIRLHDQ
jgi:hypothetical protein